MTVDFYRQLSPTSGLRVSPISLGAITFAGTHGMEHFGDLDSKDAAALLSVAFEAGVNMIDVANFYSTGDAESVLGQAIKTSSDFEDFLITSKVRMVMGGGANDGGQSRWHILDQLHKSLNRLGRDHLDLYYLHEWDGQTPLEETLQTMDQLVRAGKIRYYGVSNYTSWQLMKVLLVCERNGFIKPVSQQVYYTPQARDVEYEMIPAGIDQGIGTQVWSPLGMGLLTGKYRRDSTPDSPARMMDGDGSELRITDRENMYDMVSALEEVATDYGSTIPRVVLSWLRSRPGVTNVVVGARTVDQLRDSLGSFDLELSSEAVDKISAISPPPVRYPFWHQADLASDRLSEADKSIINSTASQI